MKKQKTSFLKDNLYLLAFGFLFILFSSFGQTYLLSLYVPSIEGVLNISNTEFGSLYAIATIGSALTLPWLGGYFDKVSLKQYSILAALGLASSMLLLSFSFNFFMVLISFYGLRLFGQGLSSHTAISSMARYFSANRGKAIGLVSLGYPVGEAVFPILIAVLIAGFGWRITLQVSALQVFIILIPFALLMLNKSKEIIKTYNAEQNKADRQNLSISLLSFARDRRFWVISPIVFMLGFTNTAIFFFQLKFGEARGWSPEWVAASISAFAISGAFGMMGAGALVDKFSGKRLFPYYLIPFLFGLLVLVFYKQPLAYPLALALIGFSNGMGSTINNALMAEIYGTAVIGQVRSIFITVMVFSTALGPIAFGVLLDSAVSYSMIYTVVTIAMLLVAFNGMRRLA